MSAPRGGMGLATMRTKVDRGSKGFTVSEHLFSVVSGREKRALKGRVFLAKFYWGGANDEKGFKEFFSRISFFHINSMGNSLLCYYIENCFKKGIILWGQKHCDWGGKVEEWGHLPPSYNAKKGSAERSFYRTLPVLKG